MTRRRLFARAAGAALLLMSSAVAEAHSTFAGVGDFYAGVLHPVTALEHLLPFLAFGALAGQHAARGRAALPLFAFALLVGAGAALFLPAVPAVDVVNISSGLLLGGLIALGRPLPAAAYLVLAALFGSTHGYANGLAIAPPVAWYAFIPGVGLAGLAVTAYGFVLTDWVRRKHTGWMDIAVRAAGSWIAAIGVLVLATMWQGARL